MYQIRNMKIVFHSFDVNEFLILQLERELSDLIFLGSSIFMLLYFLQRKKYYYLQSKQYLLQNIPFHCDF